ncbi:hypothetical protein M430DRAFT_171935 [Amorphotheca resinae ATCC 22711]|uniref:Uncharacterized protein n=1 Tax=Amorphotheca resinae ATCC 22711 TaxID=857342 RepID=A0A2T3AV39_AMORE|nr:hypothetical protein M430DRAFT_171935 [Amorphotheca resinae ATCC 22711]PSS12512.1 hypothetical protein M430DRAFT_171935 [Amorphotheca resinae ATCC 22711]
MKLGALAFLSRVCIAPNVREACGSEILPYCNSSLRLSLFASFPCSLTSRFSGHFGFCGRDEAEAWREGGGFDNVARRVAQRRGDQIA